MTRAAALVVLVAACAHVERGFVDVDGVHMYYETRGEGAPLVLLNGGGESLDALAAQVAYFSTRRRVITPEQMGHGRTPDVPGRALSYHRMAEETVALLARLGVGRADFLGWSDGGNVALDVAMHHPALVRRLVVTGANFRPDGVIPDAPAPPDEKPTPFDEKLTKLWATEPSWTVDDLRKIVAPTLVMAGEHDVIKPEHTRALAAAIPHAQLCIFPGAGHGWIVDEAPRFDAIAGAFLDGS